MAEPTLSTRLSRRTMLAGAALAAAWPGVALPAAAARAADARAGDDARIALLAARYRRAWAELVQWIDLAERRHGPLAYEARPAYRGRYAALVARERRCTAALARARPASLRGLVLKLRPAFHCDDLRDAAPDCDVEVLLAALGDLERLAAGAGPLGP